MAAESPTRRVDASMDLLRQVAQGALEPEYVHAKQQGRPRSRALGALGLGLAATLLAIAAAQTSAARPSTSDERARLVAQVRAEQARHDELSAQVQQMDAQVRTLQDQALASPDLSASPAMAQAGLGAVKGPGVVVTVDDAPEMSPDQTARVGDTDLRQLVNGLWSAGAEAVSVNGHRVTARTAIRSAGSAITVDYRSLDRPYRVEAVGDPRTLGSRLSTTRGGQWWAFLRDNHHMQYQVTVVQEMTLPADLGLSTSVAKVQK